MESSHDVADLGDAVSLTGLQVSLCVVYCCAVSAIATVPLGLVVFRRYTGCSPQPALCEATPLVFLTKLG